MPRLPVISGDRFARVMRRVGYEIDHISGSHMILMNASGHRISVPKHKELDRGLLHDLITDAGLSRDEFLTLFRRR
jgi:predicted RNA binding protein YcfA (HicA-like mRNA interferase family)